MHWPILWITTGIFAITYAGLAVGKVPGLRMDRAGIAFVGATLMLVLGALTFAQAVAPDSIDYQTIFLLLGMMVVVAFLRLGGFFVRLTNWSLGRIRTPVGLLLGVILLSGCLSAFLVNDVICVAVTPLVLHLCRRLRFDPLPQLIALATAANIGSVGTITGNPQNMIIGVQSHIAYGTFAAHLMPVAMLGLMIDFFVIWAVYRSRLAGQDVAPTANEDLPHDRVHSGHAQNWIMIKSVGVTLIAVVLFFAGLPIALVAMGAAAVLLIGRVRPAKVYRQIDWGLLLMFVGLFIVVRAFQLQVVSHWGIEHWDWLLAHPVDRLSLASAALSNLVSNVPAVLLFEPVMRAIPGAGAGGGQQHAWLALAMSSTFAGNLTILGSVANLIVVESARREGVAVPFWEYCRVGIPVTVLTLALGVAWLTWAPY